MGEAPRKSPTRLRDRIQSGGCPTGVKF